MISEGGERTLKLHFTLYNSEGKRLYGNAAFSTFAEEELDIYTIANDALFSAINRMLAECTAELTILSKITLIKKTYALFITLLFMF